MVWTSQSSEEVNCTAQRSRLPSYLKTVLLPYHKYTPEYRKRVSLQCGLVAHVSGVLRTVGGCAPENRCVHPRPHLGRLAERWQERDSCSRTLSECVPLSSQRTTIHPNLHQSTHLLVLTWKSMFTVVFKMKGKVRWGVRILLSWSATKCQAWQRTRNSEYKTP